MLAAANFAEDILPQPLPVKVPETTDLASQ
jgi:hypothetical protein